VTAPGGVAATTVGGYARGGVAKRKFIKGAVKHPGALNRDVGGKSSERLAKVKYLAEHGTPEQKRRARFYLGVLRPLNRKRKAARA